MKKVEVYSKYWCPYCLAAKRLLTERGIEFVEIDIEVEPEKRAEMIERSRRFTVPQIFVGGFGVGGFDDLSAADKSGLLDQLLTYEHVGNCEEAIC